jgi:hypothetical protein
MVWIRSARFRRLFRQRSLVPHAILAGENAHKSSPVVLRGNVDKQAARVFFADDFELCQGNEERLGRFALSASICSRLATYAPSRGSGCTAR